MDMPPSQVLYQGDALNVLPRLPSQSFDLVLTDPPYLFGRIPRVKGGIEAALDAGGHKLASALPGLFF